MRQKITAVFAASLLAVSAPLLTACTTTSQADAPASSTESATTEALTLGDGWAKSAASGGMTGVFGLLENHSDQPATLVSVESDAAGMIELHEVTADGVMQKIAEDVVIAAGGSFELAPGANHIMLMQLHHDLLAGDEVTFTLNYLVGDEPRSTEYSVLVKDYSGANEDYAPGHGDDAHSDDAHSDEDHAGHEGADHDGASADHASH